MNINPFLDFILALIGLYKTGLFINIIINLLVSFDIVNRHNVIVNKICYAFDRLYDPILVKLRQILPNLGGIDISPILLFLILDLLNNIIVKYLYQ